jgi:hypothetical protein
VYPYVTSSTTTFSQYNFDLDYTGRITITTPITVHTVVAISGNASMATSDYPVTDDEQQVTWAVQVNDIVRAGEDGTIWFTDQDGTPLLTFTRSYYTTRPAPPQDPLCCIFLPLIFKVSLSDSF